MDIENNNVEVSNLKVEEIKIETTAGKLLKRWIITENDLPLYQINDFLLDKGLNKGATNYTYAYSLIKLLKFLNKRNISYLDCTQHQAKQYVRSLILGDMEDLKILDKSGQVTYATMKKDIAVMTEFYKFMRNEQYDIEMSFENKELSRKRSYLYGQIFEYNYESIVDKYMGTLKPSKRYIKWYEEDDKKAILSNFTTLRDEVVFLLTLEGMRIDEVLSLKLSNVDEFEQCVQPSRSKRKKDLDDEIRIISLPSLTFQKLMEYINTERADAESESGIFSDDVFINLRKGLKQGQVLKYHNYLKILKDTAKRGGLNKAQIRTHSGRSTKVNELLEHQVLYPEDNLTDEIIREMLGWKNSVSIEPYKNKGNRVIAKKAAEKINNRKKE